MILILTKIALYGLGVVGGRLVTPWFGVTSSWLNILLNISITIGFIILLEVIWSKITTGRIKSLSLNEPEDLYKVDKSELSKAIMVLSDSFKEDVLVKKLFGKSADRRRDLTSFGEFLLKHCYMYGSVYATSDKFEGVIAIIQGENSNMTLWRMIRSGSIFAFLRMGIKVFIKMGTVMSPIDIVRRKQMKNRNFIYIQIIGVCHHNQGMGYGGMMLKQVIAIAEDFNLPLYLETETESNVRFYERYGFKIREKMKLPLINQEMWAMVREVNED
ncbi:GNAT family N-acetyltransferase [bacterium]|nr:GNAT family N-acetyltransferase [bacterium]